MKDNPRTGLPGAGDRRPGNPGGGGGAWSLAFRLARREMRGLRGFGIFLACLALGVAVIATVGSLSAAIHAGLAGDARILLGGDLEFHLANRQVSPEERDALAESGQLAETVQLHAMAHSAEGDKRSLVELKAVDRSYPLYGAVTLDPAAGLPAALAQEDGVWGAAVDPALLARLGLRLGDKLKIGAASFVIRARLTAEPDLGGEMMLLGPRVMIALDALGSTDLAQPGALVAHSYRLRLPQTLAASSVKAQLETQFPDAGWRVRDTGNATPMLRQLLDRVALFLTLVGLTSLLVGGVGVGNAVRFYLAGKTETIGILKCLGAPSRLIFRIYLAQILALAALGIALGLAIGAIAPLFLAHLFAAALPISLRAGLYPRPLGIAAAFGFLVTLAFSLWPLGRAPMVSAASLFRSLVAPEEGRPAAPYLFGIAVAGLALAGLAVITAPDRAVTLWFAAGAALTLLFFRIAALAILVGARTLPRLGNPALRIAIANLHRPGALTGSIVLSLGIGLTVLVAITLIEGNMLGEVREALPRAAPSYFFIDIQPDQTAEFDRLMVSLPGVVGFDSVPSMRGRILRINGVPVEKAKVDQRAQWALTSERGLTYAAVPPKGSRVVAGEWWPADYHGPPLVSFDADLARGMGVKPGDTLTVDLLGREITARIANLRSIDWTSLGINFAIVFAPGALEAAPQTHIATARVDRAAEDAVERAVTDRFPNISAIHVRDALETVARIMTQIGTAVRVMAGLTLLAGTLVVAGAVAAGHRRRVYDSVILKVLGAGRLAIARIFLIEYGMLGLVTASLAAALGTAAAYLFLTRIMSSSWVFLPARVVMMAALATLVTLVIGFAGTWRALGVKPAAMLRNE